MRLCLGGVPLILTVTLGLACSEGPEQSSELQAVNATSLARARFPLLGPMLDQALELERTDAGFKPVVADAMLKPATGRWRRPGPHRLEVTLPLASRGATRVTSGPVTVEISSLGIGDVPAARGDGALVFAGAYPHADTLHLVEAERVEEFILLRNPRAPQRFEYELKVLRGGGRVRQLEGVVEVLDGEGNAWLRLAPPWLVDGDGKRELLRPRLEGQRLVLALPVGTRRYPVMVDPGWTTTGGMAGTYQHNALTRLASGKVLVSGSEKSKAAEIYDPATGTWTTTGSSKCIHADSTATLLKDSRVLQLGGDSKHQTCPARSAELYDPVKGTWTPTGFLSTNRSAHTATLLANGKVLVTGGVYTRSAELYDPVTEKWTPTMSMVAVRSSHTATLLASGSVLVAGGAYSGSLASAELYDPATGKWTATGSMAEGRYIHTATRLGNGAVLVSGGFSNSKNKELGSVELYHPATGTWTAVGSLAVGRRSHAAALLGDGSVLVAGGVKSGGPAFKSVELYDPTKATWTAVSGMATGRVFFEAVTLGSGMVLVASGTTAELYDPTSGLTCSKAADCASGFCVDGICCETACADVCKICKVQKNMGRCVFIAAATQDTYPGNNCAGAKACDGKGVCKLANGQVCTSGSLCGSGFCVDGRCCASACTATCKSCAVSGSLGTCSNLPAHQPDPVATAQCTGVMACDGKGACKKVAGQSCSVAGQCVDGRCVDGVCCGSACAATCKSCAVTGSLGSCANVLAGKPDAFPVGACTTTRACDGKGACKKANGQACSAAGDCASGLCVDGYCCESACSATCMSCAVSGKLGSCTFVPAAQHDSFPAGACVAAKACDGTGTCIKANGQACAGPGECGSGFCVDGRCCASACAATCKACNLAGNLGTCANIADMLPDTNATATCSGSKACDGKGSCHLICAGATCVTDRCVDGKCCDSACMGRCMACHLPGKQGTCSFVPADQFDANATQPCTGAKACDGAGSCLKASGQACVKHTDCGSGFCADGYCCKTACSGRCKSCAVPGSLGVCGDVPAGQPDTNASPPCTSPQACDGAGTCKKGVGQSCALAADCASDFCADGVCCGAACGETCRSCGLSTSLGSCALIPAGAPDPLATTPCTGSSACDGSGSCKKTNGQACSSAGECVSGFCADWVCCDAACSGTCLACNLVASPGKCGAVLSGQADANAAIPCTGVQACDGTGSCKKAGGRACTQASECASGKCADGVCCDSECSGSCMSCNLTGKLGSCSAVPSGKADAKATTPCTGDKVCDGAGACLTAQGKTCGADKDCLTGICKDKVCCDKACDKTCESCALAGKVGSCGLILKGSDPDGECLGKDLKCGGLCDGAGQCGFPGLGTLCDTCKACDGTGSCSKTPVDDSACGVLDCDQLDTTCRDYLDLTTGRCDSLGVCKKPNTSATCTKYTDLQCDAGAPDLFRPDLGAPDSSTADMPVSADVAPAREGGVNPPETVDEGCSCAAAGGSGPGGGLLLLLVMFAGAWHRRIGNRPV